tara:strand:- start:4184 stop:6160 length:1977 start_codon:yes stop_codon:yes gene_type:complete
MAKRKYTKRSEYWNKFKNEKPTPPPPVSETHEPDLLGEPFYVSSASKMQVSKANYKRTGARDSITRVNRSAVSPTIDKYSSIRNGLLPYQFSMDGVNIRLAIELCQKAYANVAVFRNAVDIMAEFSNTEIFLEGGTQRSRSFFENWFKRINLNNLKDQYFREYYRSGNIFLYRIDGKFKVEDFSRLVRSIPSDVDSENTIPMRYILLNPFDIVAKRASTFSIGAYEKVLSEYELSRLQNPITEEDQQIFDSLPDDMKEGIEQGYYYSDGLKIELDPKKLSYSFYKKQDYEPFAVPFGFPVLEDINAKLELKKMDQAITRTVENVILLITMGAEPEKGGINAQNLMAMQTLFKNESVGRVLVSDYTTKADFIIPDLNKVLGSEKYKVLNEDIKQGLQNIVVGEEKYSSTQVKAKIFIDRLKEARNAFVHDFLQKEIKRIAKNLGFRSFPQVVMKDIDMRDETQLMRVSTRLMELGIITPQQGMEMFHTGKFPNAEDISGAQQSFIDERERGFYNPIVGGVPMITDEPKAQEKNQTNKQAGRPEGTTDIPLSESSYSRKAIQSTVGSLEDFRKTVRSIMKDSMGIKRFSKNHNQMLDKLCESVVCASDLENWEQTAISCVNNIENLESLEVLPEILEISAKHELDNYSAAILYHSNNATV